MRTPFLLPALLLVLAGVPTAGQSLPDAPADGIADLAGVLTPADADSIRAVIGRMQANPGVDVRVLTVERVAAGTPEAFATSVYNRWRVGAGQEEDGVLVLLSVEDRFTRIELGDRVPAEQDARMRGIVQDVMVPRLAGGDVSGGLREGVLAIAAAFGTPPPASASPEGTAPAPAIQPAYIPPPRTRAAYHEDMQISGGELAAMLLVGVLLAGGGVLVYLRTRKRICGQCGGGMVRLPEADGDAYLDRGRRMEEALGSVKYDVWRCAACGDRQVAGDPRFSEHDRCAECGYRTVSTTRTVAHPPTYDVGGTEEVEKKCAQCGWSHVEIVHLPRKRRPKPRLTAEERRLEELYREEAASSREDSEGGHSSGRGASGRW